MNFVDIFKKSFLESYTASNFSIKQIIILIVITSILSMYVFLMYSLVNKKSFYNKSFHVSLPALALITMGIIMTIQSSIVVSLGMVGALSIVRFRTAVKEPMDLIFLFWSISIGIMCGANCISVAILISMGVTLLIFLAVLFPVGKASNILLVNAENYCDEEKILEIVNNFCSLYKVKARNLTKDHLDMAIEVRVRDGGNLVSSLMEIDSILSASLVNHEGEATF